MFRDCDTLYINFIAEKSNLTIFALQEFFFGFRYADILVGVLHALLPALLQTGNDVLQLPF